MASGRCQQRRWRPLPFVPLFVHLLVLCSWISSTWAYVPAVPINNTAGGPVLDNSTLTIKWQPNGLVGMPVLYRLALPGSTGFSEGALVSFSERNLTNGTTITPWIALINCDLNVTNSSMDTDIFTEAQERGAVAALLYSTFSDSCIIDPEYLDPDNFDQIMDVFATPTLSYAKLIESQFSNVNEMLYRGFDAARLNASIDAVHQALNGTLSMTGTYLVAQLESGNATAGPDATTGGSSSDDASSGKSSGHSTGLAMIILYAITGCVSLLFCIVILSGAVRAIRHPERYGPRAPDPTMGPNGMGQSRTGGLTRAILDTFPVIKFGQAPRQEEFDAPAKVIDSENPLLGIVQMHDLSPRTPLTPDELHSHDSGKQTRLLPEASEGRPQSASSGSDIRLESASASSPVTAMAPQRTMVAAPTEPMIGRDTCPICLVEFEEGDDLRVLPCEGKHQFHRDCVDPWLLESSGSCPLCREDFHVLEDHHESDEDVEMAEPTQRRSARFSKLLRFKRRRRPSTSPQPPTGSSGNASTSNLSTSGSGAQVPVGG